MRGNALIWSDPCVRLRGAADLIGMALVLGIFVFGPGFWVDRVEDSLDSEEVVEVDLAGKFLVRCYSEGTPGEDLPGVFWYCEDLLAARCGWW